MRALLILVCVCMNPLQAATIVLFNSAAGTGPDAQGWLAGAALPGTSISSNTTGTTVDTLLSNSLYAGYSNYTFVLGPGPTISPGSFVNALFPNLDRATGFTLHFVFQMNNQVNDGANGPDRAGFSITLLGSDKKGIEIGFRSSDIFSQSGPGFTVGELNNSAGIASLLSNMTTYQLTILGEVYTLSSGGNTLLTGAVRDYTSAVGFASDGYRATNFLALGDNTTSARSSFTLQELSLTTDVPEPATFSLMAATALLGVYRVRRLRAGAR